MKNRAILISVILITSNFLFSQKITSKANVEYIFKTNLEVLKSREGLSTLYLSPTKSFFEFTSAPKTTKIVEKGNNIHVLSGNQNGFFSLIDLENKFIINEIDLGGKAVVLKDSLSVPNWQTIPNKKKRINNTLCLYAKCQFYGRTYYAWYTPSIPYPFGPYKFHGLPGLILEIKSHDNSIRFYLKGFDLKKLEIDIPKFKQKELLNVCELEKKLQSDFDRRIQLMLSEGMEIDGIERNSNQLDWQIENYLINCEN